MTEKFLNPIIITDNVILAERIYHSAVEVGALIKNFAATDKKVYAQLEQLGFQNVILVNLKFETDVANIVRNFDLIFSIHCKQLFPKKLLEQRLCINLHPGFNPINRGWYPQVFAIEHDRIVGATLHEIDEFLDHGKIIERIEVPRYLWDTSLSLYNRILDAEVALFKRNIKNIIENNYSSYLPESEGFIYYKTDFASLCEINLNEQVDFRSAINRLRALTHGSFKNAWFRDESTGKKVYISISLTPEDDLS
jgi:methionyl-tRNA formyltransferase